MTPSPTPQSQGHYFVPATSNYSTFLSAGIFMLALGFIFKLNGVPAGTWSMLFGAALILYVIFWLVWRGDQRER